MKFGPIPVLENLGIDYIDRPNRLAMCCVFHHDSDPSAGFYLDTELFHCFSCEITYDVVTFYAKYKEITRDEAYQELRSVFGEIPERPRVDTMGIETTRAKAEKVLRSHKEGMERLPHAKLGETLDRIMLAYRRGQIDNLKLDKAMKVWYNRVTEEDVDVVSGDL